jgi:hypothetical protein
MRDARRAVNHPEEPREGPCETTRDQKKALPNMGFVQLPALARGILWSAA